MGYKKIKKELYNVAVPLSCISIRCWFAAADRSRCLALLYKLLWPRSLKLPDARHDPRAHVWASVTRLPHSACGPPSGGRRTVRVQLACYGCARCEAVVKASPFPAGVHRPGPVVEGDVVAAPARRVAAPPVR